MVCQCHGTERLPAGPRNICLFKIVEITKCRVCKYCNYPLLKALHPHRKTVMSRHQMIQLTLPRIKGPTLGIVQKHKGQRKSLPRTTWEWCIKNPPMQSWSQSCDSWDAPISCHNGDSDKHWAIDFYGTDFFVMKPRTGLNDGLEWVHFTTTVPHWVCISGANLRIPGTRFREKTSTKSSAFDTKKL